MRVYTHGVMYVGEQKMQSSVHSGLLNFIQSSIAGSKNILFSTVPKFDLHHKFNIDVRPGDFMCMYSM